MGRFINVDGVRLHYIERGEGPPLVLLHGNGSMIEDFASSGLVGFAALRHRVIVFDRPGYGHSTRPRRKVWSADAQAELIHPPSSRSASLARSCWGIPGAHRWLRRSPSGTLTQ